MDHGDTSMRQMDTVWSDGAPLPWIYDVKGSTDEPRLGQAAASPKRQLDDVSPVVGFICWSRSLRVSVT